MLVGFHIIFVLMIFLVSSYPVIYILYQYIALDSLYTHIMYYCTIDKHRANLINFNYIAEITLKLLKCYTVLGVYDAGNLGKIIVQRHAPNTGTEHCLAPQAHRCGDCKWYVLNLIYNIPERQVFVLYSLKYSKPQNVVGKLFRTVFSYFPFASTFPICFFSYVYEYSCVASIVASNARYRNITPN